MDFSDRCRTCLKCRDQYILTNITNQCYVKKTLKEVLLMLVPDIVGSVSDTDCVCVNCAETLRRSAELIEKCLTIEANLKRCTNNKTDPLAKNGKSDTQSTNTNYLNFIICNNNSIGSSAQPVQFSNVFLNSAEPVHGEVKNLGTTTEVGHKNCGPDCPADDHNYCVTDVTSKQPISKNLTNISLIEGIKSRHNRILTLEPTVNTDLASFVTCLTQNDISITDISTNIDDRKKRILLIGTEAPTKCPTCKKSLKYERLHVCQKVKNLLEEKKKRKTDKCSKCNKDIYEGYMKVHLQKHARDEVRQAKREKTKMMRKMAQLTCRTCNERFPNNEEFECHLEIHPPYVCEQCGKGFAKKDTLKAHKHSHNDPNSYICEVCGKGYKDHNTLRQHLQLHNDTMYKCSLCPKTFKQKLGVSRHVKQVHNKSYNCQCPLCGRLFSGSAIMQTHMKLVHDKEKPYQCNICQKRFGRSDYLRNHMACHTGDRKSKPATGPRLRRPRRARYKIQDNGEPLPCKFCGSWYKGIIPLKRHLETHVRRYQCQFCPLTFGRKALMQRHAKVHEGGKVTFYRCNVCWKRFSTKETLDEHIICHDNPRYSCEICGKLFNRRFLMSHHILMEHNDIADDNHAEEVIYDSILQVCNDTSLIQPE